MNYMTNDVSIFKVNSKEDSSMKSFIVNVWKKYEEEIRYLIVGVITTVVSWFAKWLGTFILDPAVVWQNSLLTVIQWCAGVATAFVLNRKYVFRSKDPNWFGELAKLCSGRIGTGLAGLIALNVLVNALGVNLWAATFGWAVVETIANYIISKFWVFKK